MATTQSLIAGYQQWVQELNCDGRFRYLMTFTFREMNKSPAATLANMLREVDRVYAIHATRVVRNPRGKHDHCKLPIWIVSPDLPVLKREKDGSSNSNVNHGLHLHAVGLYRQKSRLAVPVDQHFQEQHNLYTNPEHPLFRIHVKMIEDRIDEAVDYAMKGGKRWQLGSDIFHVLPRSRTELTS